MALIIYPSVGYDSFATVAELDVYITNYIGSTAWSSLTPEQKELYARQSTLQMQLCDNITLPTTRENDLISAQALLAVHIVDIGTMEFGQSNDRAVTSEKVASIQVDYNPYLKNDPTNPPNTFYAVMAQYGCVVSGSGGFSQSTITRG